MNDKRTILFWGGLLSAMLAIFLMNNWIKNQMKENPMPSQVVVRPAVPVEKEPSLAADVVEELNMAEEALATDPQSVQPREKQVEDQDIIYETPLTSPILMQ
ncbi:MAG TPA: hypothetical protein VJA17_05235 [Candidatus Omnitrophota bacterium]|nr:hypothetical protein [Candidatus Omnitrophota bacterium]